MSGPGRRALIYRAAYHPHISDKERVTLLKIALPLGASINDAALVLGRARGSRLAGHPDEAQRILDELLDNPPMEG